MTFIEHVEDGEQGDQAGEEGDDMEGRLAGAEEVDHGGHRPDLKGRLIGPDLEVEDLALEEGSGGGDVAGLVGVPVRLEEEGMRRMPYRARGPISQTRRRSR